MKLSFALRRYRRPFKQPFQTARGRWVDRKGIIIRLEDAEGRIGFGEIAPLPEFGTESLEEALRYCETIDTTMQGIAVENIPAHLPCTQFAFACALRDMDRDIGNAPELPIARLVSGGVAGLEALTAPEACQSLKWKIGVEPMAVEQSALARLLERLPDKVMLRLDANGSLSPARAGQWLEFLEAFPQIDYLEQPLINGREAEMRILADTYNTPLALDESVCRLERAQRAVEEGWRGVLVLKPAIMGDPQRLIDWSHTVPNRLVCSSVFETGIGWCAGMRLAAAISQEPAGYDTQRFFPNDGLDSLDPQTVWAQLT